jgi:hypothetical protein
VTAPASAASEEVSLPGSIQAFTDAAIFARTTGYLKARHADIGSRVKAGQCSRRSTRPTSTSSCSGTRRPRERANRAAPDDGGPLSGSDQDRLGLAPGPRQRVGNSTKKAAVLSADANVKRLGRSTVRIIYAPFDGVYGTQHRHPCAHRLNSNAKELFHIAAVDRLQPRQRPQIYSSAARPARRRHPDPNLPGRVRGHLARTAGDRPRRARCSPKSTSTTAA